MPQATGGEDVTQIDDQLEGMTVQGDDGSKIGKVTNVYYDNDTNKPEWAAVATGLFGSKETLVPLAAAHRNGDLLSVPFDKDRVKGAPHNDPDGELSETQEAELFSY
jgi:sporulation protein YlmC with PRC-barrel domain